MLAGTYTPPVPVPPRRARRVGLLSPGPLLVLIFVGEAILTKSRVPGLSISFVAHMTATAVLLGVIFSVVILPHVARRGPRIAAHRNLRGIRICLVLLIVWGFLSCFAQEAVLVNVLYWLLWAGHHFAIWWLVVALLDRMDAAARLRMISAVLLTCVVGSLLLHPVNGMPQGRLIGMFGNATYSGQFLALALVWWTALWLYGHIGFCWFVLLATPTAPMLIMTRTRSSMAAALVGITVAVVTAARRGWSPSRLGLRRAALAIFVLSVAFIYVVSSQAFDDPEVARYLRIEGGASGVYAGRARYWQAGYQRLPSCGLFGWGFLSKYGRSEATRQVFGISVPMYDWTTTADPLNSLLLTAQQIGLPGMVLFAMLIVALARGCLRAGGRRKGLAVAILAVMVTLTVGENWLTSFGAPLDRLGAVALALLLSAPEEMPLQEHPSERALHRPGDGSQTEAEV